VTSLPLGHALARMGAQIILSPCAWAVVPDRDPKTDPYGAEWHEPYSLLSGLYHIPVIGVSNVGQVSAGTWKGWKAIGNSIAYDSDGTLKTVLPYGEDAECVRVIEVELKDPEHTGTALSEAVSEAA
jgi:predicted amidohydrolase